jgi:hypothetical protein
MTLRSLWMLAVGLSTGFLIGAGRTALSEPEVFAGSAVYQPPIWCVPVKNLRVFVDLAQRIRLDPAGLL